MSSRVYDNFDVLIEALDAGRFRIRVTHCAVGETPALVSALPFSGLELENIRLKLDPGRSGTRRISDPFTRAAADMGGGLFDAVFRDDVLVAWSRSNDAAREQHHGVRLRLRLVDAPELAGLPWEFLYDRRANCFFAQSDRTPVVRYLDVARPPRPLVVDGPLRILAVISSPHDLPALDVEREWASIRDALADRVDAGQVVVDRLPQASLPELQRWLRRHEVHILHFVGHGDFDERTGDGVLAFCDPSGRTVPVSSAQLGAHVRDHDPLRLVLLNACQTATSDKADAYSGMAAGLIQQEAAAVVAMQFPITDEAALVFSSEFYGALADGEPVDQAVTSARKAMLSEHGREWATPVLYLRSGDGRIFDRGRSDRDLTPTEPIERPTEDLRPTGPIPLTPATTPSVAPPPAVPPPPFRPPPSGPADVPGHASSGGRRRTIAAILTAVVLVLGGGTAGAVLLTRGSGTPTPPNPRPAPTSTVTSSRSPSPTAPTTPTPPPTIVSVTHAATTYSGPSRTAYRHALDLAAGTKVGLVCAIYADNSGGDFLWYWTDKKWINDDDVQTGTGQPVRNACAGNVNAPTAGTAKPSSALGPFAVVGHDTVPIRTGPHRDASPTGDVVAPDTMVALTCHAAGDSTAAPPGGHSSADWDRIVPTGWIPDADLLTGRAGSPAPACSDGTGGGTGGGGGHATTQPSSAVTTTSSGPTSSHPTIVIIPRPVAPPDGTFAPP